MKNHRWDERIQEILSPKRYRHSVGVAKLAERLAEVHGVDPERLHVAGFLHDAAKELPDEEMERLFRREEPQRFREVADFPKLWHGEVSAMLAQEEFGVEDEVVLDAIRYHPTGHPSFGKVGHILYVADYCDPGREDRDQAEIVRRAETDLLGAVLEVIEKKEEHLRDVGREVHPRATAFRESVLKRKAEE